MNNELDQASKLLAHLICADADHQSEGDISVFKSVNRQIRAEIDAGARLKFENQFPIVSYTFDLSGDDRIYANDAGLLVNSVQDLIGNRTEVAFVCQDRVKWACFKKVAKTPKFVWVANPRADIYELHHREVFLDGRSNYAKRVIAIDKNGRPVSTVIEGSAGKDPMPEQIIIAASIVEDAHRIGTFLATVTDSAGVKFPVAQGSHLDIFKLRDGPYSGSRRKALLHWVASHIRKTKRSETVVKDHLRGIHQFNIDGFEVVLEAKE